MSHGLAPLCANSTIFCRVESGRGRPLTKRPPSWFIPPCPEMRPKKGRLSMYFHGGRYFKTFQYIYLIYYGDMYHTAQKKYTKMTICNIVVVHQIYSYILQNIDHKCK